jgi:hypothetical protein
MAFFLRPTVQATSAGRLRMSAGGRALYIRRYFDGRLLFNVLQSLISVSRLARFWLRGAGLFIYPAWW